MLFQLLATTSRAADLTSLYGSFIFSSKKLAKKTPKIKEVYTAAHAGCQQEWVPEGTKSQICIRIIYFLHEFCAMTPRPLRSTRFPVSNRQHPHVKDHTGLGGPNSLKLAIVLELFEGVACYERHPWDVRVKVGSERKFASSDNFTNFRQLSPTFGVNKILVFL